MADDARAGALTPEQAERFASAIRPLWETLQPPDETVTNVVIPQAAPSGPRELFGAPNESILGPSPSAQYKVMRASQPPPNEVMPLDRTLIMSPSTPPPPNVGGAMSTQSPFTKTFAMDGAPAVPNGPFSRPGSDLRFSSPPPAPEAMDSYLMDDATEMPKTRGRGLVVVAILCGIGIGGLLAVRFLGSTQDTRVPAASGTPSASAVSAEIVVPSSPAEGIAVPSATTAFAIPAPTAATASASVSAVPPAPPPAAEPVAVKEQPKEAPIAAKPRYVKPAENPAPLPVRPTPRAATPRPETARPTPAPTPVKPANPPSSSSGGITRDAPF